MRTRRLLTALSAAVLLTAAGCSGDGGESGGGGVEAPAGGWPQPQNGQLTDKMCGLITKADYEEFNHRQLLDLEPESAYKASSNGFSCGAPPADQLAMTLQPTVESAKVYYAGSLASRKFQVTSDKRATMLTEGVVTGADESWLDYWVNSGPDEKYQDYELEFRRGSLVVSLVLSGVDDAEAKKNDPQGTLVALADRVLQRVGDLGKTDAGVTPRLHLEVFGKGKADVIQYSAPDYGSKTLKKVKLPWKTDLPLADRGDNMQQFSLSAQSPIAAGIPPSLACRILRDDKILANEQNFGFASCLGHFPK